MRFLTSWTLIFGLLSTLPATAANSDAKFSAAQTQKLNLVKHCENFPGGELDGGFCIHPNSNGHFNGDVLYHFHGMGGSEHVWGVKSHYSDQIREYWQENHVEAPLVISISFGEIWLLAEKNASEYSGLFELMTQTIIPMIENKLGLDVHRRFLVGESMGGFNSIQMGLKTNMFEKVAVLCASMATLSPWATDEETHAFIENSRAWPYWNSSEADRNNVRVRIARLKQLAQTFFPTAADWANANPLSIVLRTRENKLPVKFYITAGVYDPFLLYEGNVSFQNDLRKLVSSVEWRPVYGGHCAADIPTLADFLAP